ncbi:hypothetical protein [Syntrophorhabdus aromaticivorans]|uniref:hypothetical protein n=1 Tax=Syntrophorhabdus aromaticivorans TaxID=328301 RepID=UPI001A9A5198|nr:hypothetical protein [Syntrophorhabdus aromaticivorans]
MSPEKRFARTKTNYRAAWDRKGGWPPLLSSAIAVNPDAPPTHVLHNLDKVNGLAQVKSFHAAINLVHLELGCLMNHYSPWGVTSVTAAVEVDRACHDPEHLGTRQKGIIALDLNFVGVIDDKLEARSLGVEDLAAARHESRAF